MSLFISRDWWSVNCGSDEHFSANSLEIANIDNNPDGSDKMITGSLEGILRIYTTCSSSDEISSLKPSQANDLLLEVDLKLPILQISCGHLLTDSKSLHLAVLHPRKFSVYSISTTHGVADHGSAYNILLLYEHSLPKSSYNFVLGPFGQIKDRDFICIQSLDGTLFFYEQESFAFSRQLPEVLLPGPLIYLATNDSFVLSSSSWCIESYRYQVLAIARSEPNQSGPLGRKLSGMDMVDSGLGELATSIIASPSYSSTSPSSTTTIGDTRRKSIDELSTDGQQSGGRKLTSDWSLSIGEPCLDLRTHSLDRRTSLIITLGERNLFLIGENGSLLWMKKLNFTPLCMHTYPSDAGEGLMILLASEMRTLLIFNEHRLLWSSRMPFTAIAVARARFHNVKGALVYLSSDGTLSAAYLGTNPSINIVPIKSSETDLIDYDEAEKELSELRRIISSYNTDGNPLDASEVGNSHSQDGSLITIQVSNPILSMVRDRGMSITEPREDVEDFLPLVDFTISLSTHSNTLTNVRLCVQGDCPFVFEPSLILFSSLTANDGDSVNPNNIATIVATLSSPLIPASLKADVVVTYFSEKNVPKVIRDTFHLPLSLVCRTVQATRDLPLRLTFDLLAKSGSPNPLDLRQILLDLTNSESMASSGTGGEGSMNIESDYVSIGFYAESSVNVSIYVHGKQSSSQQIRIQSNSLHGLSFIIVELLNRLAFFKYSIEHGKMDRKQVPIKEYLALVDQRFATRIKLLETSARLGQLSGYYRAIQKRLLVKFRDRNSSSLSNMDILIEDIHSKILKCTNELVLLQKDFERLSNALSSATSLFHRILEISVDLPKDSVNRIHCLWSATVSPDLEEGWEERTEVSFMSLFSESGGPGTGLINSQLEIPSDTNHLKVLINALIDRVFTERTLREPASSVAGTSSFGGNVALRGKKSFSMGSSAEMIQEEEEECPEKECEKNE
ncbi:Bardet-Biedl syndrome 9 [Brevipalpus obovatus]|uniref:Bardet-Biedl syndrome 9 n=1 Tax=Brevipalpus obovatus TaxID=246614 RepID=UPI003D9F64A9